MAAKGAVRQGSAEKVSSIPHTRINDEKQMEEIYQVKGLLGEGSFGVVREVLHLDTNERWACKAINKEKAGSSRIKLLEREVAILKRVQHEHIIRLKEVFETSQKMYLVMELCEGGELSKYLCTQGPMDEPVVKQIIARLSDAISYLHKNDMVHRDMKLENILLSPDPQNIDDKFYIKVTDFGLSVVKGGIGHENMMMDFCGTPLYMAPEILDNKAYGQLCDVWAMGVIMYSLVTGGPPFQNSVDEELFNMIRNADIRKIVSQDSYWQKFSKEAKDLIQGMLDKDPAHRLTASEVLHHSWITGQDAKAGPKNVLEMMKEWSTTLDDDSNSVNGGRRTSIVDIEPHENKHDSKDESTGSDKKTKQGLSASRTTPTGKSKKMTRNTTDPNLLQSGKTTAKSTTPNSGNISSKSPIDKNGLSNPSTKAGSKGQQYHGPKPSATSTTIPNPSVSTPSSGINPSSNRTSLSHPPTDQNHKPKKKISR